jgi:UTP-glucose-1-phosphate uridylyltransferase
LRNQSVKTLVILAAGRGSRFGGPKQLHQFGILNKTLMEYNICHAIDNGFKKIVFITQKAFEVQLTKQVINKLPSNIQSHLVFQNISDRPKECIISPSRTKPLGTAHALWCARNVIDEGFVVINADDYYGKLAFELITEESENYPLAIVAYQLKQTLSKYGGVNRGICKLTQNNELIDLTEVEDINRINHQKITGKLDNSTYQSFEASCLVSMNFWYFNQQIFLLLKQLLINTFHSMETNENECYLPDVIAVSQRNNQQRAKVLASHDVWFGVTYAADSAYVNQKLTELTNKGLFTSLTKNIKSKIKS